MAADRPARQPAAFDASFVDELADRLSAIVVERVLELIREEALSARTSGPPTWIDAQEVARRLGVTREWVYEHAGELGAAKIGNGPRPRLRFPPRLVEDRAADAHNRTSESSTGRNLATRGLIPIRGS